MLKSYHNNFICSSTPNTGFGLPNSGFGATASTGFGSPAMVGQSNNLGFGSPPIFGSMGMYIISIFQYSFVLFNYYFNLIFRNYLWKINRF